MRTEASPRGNPAVTTSSFRNSIPARACSEGGRRPRTECLDSHDGRTRKTAPRSDGARKAFDDLFKFSVGLFAHAGPREPPPLVLRGARGIALLQAALGMTTSPAADHEQTDGDRGRNDGDEGREQLEQQHVGDRQGLWATRVLADGESACLSFYQFSQYAKQPMNTAGG